MKIFLKVLEKLKKPSGYSNPEELDPLFCRYNKGWNDAIAKVEELISSYNVSDMWIPVSEKLPEDGVPVNITWINKNPMPCYEQIKDVPFSATAIYYKGSWYWFSTGCIGYCETYGENTQDLVWDGIDITHWMPLPEPYKEKKHE